MDKFSVLKSRLNAAFGIISLFTAVSVLIGAVTNIVKSISGIIVKEFSLTLVSDTFDFYVSFILPQLLLPLLTLAVAFLIPIFGSYKIKPCIKSEKVPIVYFLLCIGIFPGFSVIATDASFRFADVLNSVGVPVHNFTSDIPIPQTPFQIFMLVFVMAVLPAVCEELIYRGFLLRSIAEFGKTSAIVISSFAFGMMHANLLQIPYAFVMGLFLSYISLRFKSVILPITLHFINNLYASFILILQNYLDYEVVYMVDYYMGLFFVVLCILCTIIFIVLTIREKARAEIKSDSEFLGTEQGVKNSVYRERAGYLQAVTQSWGFWLFTAVYLFLTVLNISGAA